MAANRARRNAVRFQITADFTMDALQFSRLIIQKELGFRPTHLDFVFAYPGGKKFEIIFTTFVMFEQCTQRFEEKKDSEALKNFMMTCLTEPEKRWVNITMYNEFVQPWDIKTWLKQYCIVIHGDRVRDADGVKTGLFKAQVTLRKNKDTGELQHIPSCIRLGAAQGNVFYVGQPKKCRKCEGTGHLARDCKELYCNNCQQTGHEALECTITKSCNLCGSQEHVFRDCPKSYAAKMRAETLSKASTWKEKNAQDLAEEEERLKEEERLAEEAFINDMEVGEEGGGPSDTGGFTDSAARATPQGSDARILHESGAKPPTPLAGYLQKVGAKIAEIRKMGKSLPTGAENVVVTGEPELAEETKNKGQDGACTSKPRQQPPNKDQADEQSTEKGSNHKMAAGGGANKKFASEEQTETEAAVTERNESTTAKPLSEQGAKPWQRVSRSKAPPPKARGEETSTAPAPTPKPNRKAKSSTGTPIGEFENAGQEGKSSLEVDLTNRFGVLKEENLSETPELFLSPEGPEISQAPKPKGGAVAKTFSNSRKKEIVQDPLDSIDHACKALELSRAGNSEEDDTKMEWGDCVGQEEEEVACMDLTTTRKRKEKGPNKGSDSEEDSDEYPEESEDQDGYGRQTPNNTAGGGPDLTPDTRQEKKKNKKSKK